MSLGISIGNWDRYVGMGLRLGIRIRDWALGLRIGHWGFGFGLGIGIEDRDWELGLRIRIWIGNGDWE